MLWASDFPTGPLALAHCGNLQCSSAIEAPLALMKFPGTLLNLIHCWEPMKNSSINLLCLGRKGLASQVGINKFSVFQSNLEATHSNLHTNADKQPPIVRQDGEGCQILLSKLSVCHNPVPWKIYLMTCFTIKCQDWEMTLDISQYRMHWQFPFL